MEVESLSVGVAQRGVGQVVVQQVAGQTSDEGGVLLGLRFQKLAESLQNLLNGTANLIRKLCLKLNCRRKVHSIVVNATFNVDVITGGSLMSVPLAG